MSIIGGLDVHRAQITFDWVDRDSGETRRGRIAPATRATLRGWLGELARVEGAFAVEGCTGWRFVVEELQAAGLVAHLAEPAETSSLRGPKRRAKTDRADARLLRELLEQGRLPCSWIPPGWILDLRTTVRLRKTLVDQRTAWQQRIHAVLFHHGLPRPTQELLAPASRAWLEGVTLPSASRQALAVALGQIDHLHAELDPIDQWLRTLARRQLGCRALMASHYGIGAITAPTILAELGDARRFGGGDQVVRATGLDITVYASDGKRSPGRLSRQGPEVLRWALFEAAKAAARPSSPDYAYYQQVKARRGGNRATLAVAQARPAGAPHPAGTRRRRARPSRRPCPARGGLTVAGACPPTGTQMCRGQRPPAPCRHGWSVDGPKRPRGRALRGTPHRSSCRRTLAGPRTQIRLGARTHTPITTTAVRG